MTTALPINVELPPCGASARQLGRWRRLPLKAKAGVVLLGFFVITAIIGPLVAPYNPSYESPNPALSLHSRPTRRTCSAPRRLARTCYRNS